MNRFPYRDRIVLLLLASLILAGIPGTLAAVTVGASSDGGTISVATFPKGAAVYLNGEYRGTSPVKMTEIPPGDYLVNISMAGYNPESFNLEIFSGSIREISVNLERESAVPTPVRTLPGVGSIAVDSNPGGAAVLLDGKAAGTTPASGRAALVINTVPGGEHTVTVELAGYPAYTEKVTVVKNHVVKVEADFVTPTSGTTTATTPAPIPPVATTGRTGQAPASPLIVIAACGIAGLAVVISRR